MSQEPNLSCSECGKVKNQNDSQSTSLCKCDMCGNVTCVDCNRIGPTEVVCLEMQKRMLIYYCSKCRENITKMPELWKVVEKLQREMSGLKTSGPNPAIQTTLDNIAAALTGIQREQIVINQKLEDIAALKAEIAEVKEHMPGLPTAGEFENLKAELQEQIDEIPSSADNAEFKVQIQDLPSAMDFSELKATVTTPQQNYESPSTLAVQQCREANEEEIIAETVEEEEEFRSILLGGFPEEEDGGDIIKLTDILWSLGISVDDMVAFRWGPPFLKPRYLRVDLPSSEIAKGILAASKTFPDVLRMHMANGLRFYEFSVACSDSSESNGEESNEDDSAVQKALCIKNTQQD